MVQYAGERRVFVGQPFARILETAAQEHMALIGLSTHGRMGLIHLMMGSVAERVVRLAPYPVLTVKISSADTQAVPSPSVP
jgi:nucleotide-binding universal stress UspA family protein